MAGTFYPADAGKLRAEINEMLAEAFARVSPDGRDAGSHGHAATSGTDPLIGAPRSAPAALIAPHAGYVYSGPIAASAFNTLSADASAVDRVVVIGPSHFVSFRGVALPDADLMATPLGSVPIDPEGRRRAAELPQVVTGAEPHRREHAVEVEIPFLQMVLGDFSVVPLVTGSATAEEVAEVLSALWDERTLVVVSSDLSHYHDYDTARRLDRSTADAIVGYRPQDLGQGSACGRLAIQGLLLAASARGLDVSLLDLRSSGDTAGSRDEVVGYGAFHVA